MEGVTYLPNHESKRGMYTRFCNESGWELEYLAKGDYKATVVSDNFLPICFWKQQYPKIRLGSAAEGVCTACHIFFNEMKYK